MQLSLLSDDTITSFCGLSDVSHLLNDINMVVALFGILLRFLIQAWNSTLHNSIIASESSLKVTTIKAKSLCRQLRAPLKLTAFSLQNDFIALVTTMERHPASFSIPD